MIIKFMREPLSRKMYFFRILYCKFFGFLIYRTIFKKFGKGSFIDRPLMLNFEDIIIGDNVIVWKGARIESVRRYGGQIFKPSIELSNGVSFQQNCHITAAGNLFVGNNTICSFDVMITDIDHDYTDINTPIGEQNLILRETKIGSNCFIGSGVKIQAGTKLGNHCIVGTNSVVRGEFPDYSVIVGSPAKVIKRYNVSSQTWERVIS